MPRPPLPVPPEPLASPATTWQTGSPQPPAPPMPAWSPSGAQPAWGAPQPQPQPQGMTSSRERTGKFVFWFGLLGVFLLMVAETFTTSDYTRYRIVDALVSLAYLAVLAVTGWLHRRGSAVLPAILLALAGLELVLPDLSVRVAVWVYTNGFLPGTAMFTVIFAAWLAIRRAPALAWLTLLPVAGVEYVVIRYAGRLLYDDLPRRIGNAVAWPLAFVGGTALLALAALVVARLSPRDARPAPASPYAPVATASPVSAPPWGAAPAPGYATAAYAPAPGYGPPTGYGPPAGYGAPTGYAPAAGRTNTLAIIALVLGIVGVSLGGIICGHIALSQIKRTGETGRGMAITGLVLGYLWAAVVVISLIALASVGSSSSGY